MNRSSLHHLSIFFCAFICIDDGFIDDLAKKKGDQYVFCGIFFRECDEYGNFFLVDVCDCDFGILAENVF